MTECERIIERGILPREFFAPEVRNEFYVSEKRKKVWAVELDLLLEFDRVCRKHGLKYFLDGGTLLGAVRHKGFIPWDDDIDVSMPRNDYDKFLNLAYEFKHPYFLQTPYTDKGFFFAFAKIRNSNTAAINGTFLFQQDYNHGIFIDVFPFENVKVEDYAQNCAKIKELVLANSTYMRLTNPRLQDTERVRRYQGGDPLDRYETVQKICSMYKNENTDYIAFMTAQIAFSCEHYIMRAENFASQTEGTFEGFTFPIPSGWDSYLSTVYGDYMTFPPVEKRGNWHTNHIIDPDVPYKELLHKYQSEAWPENIPML